MQRSIPVPETVLASLLVHAAAAACIVGHIDDHAAAEPLADHVDAIVHELTELLHSPPASNAAVPSAHDSVLMLMSGMGGVR